MSMSTLCRLLLLALIPISFAQANDKNIKNKDDSTTIVSRLKESMDAYGLISVEQHTGRLLFNPSIEKLRDMPLKHKFVVPAMVVNQAKGLSIVTELPFSCFLISGDELTGEQYKGFKQYETARYLRDVKVKPVSRVLLCQAVGLMGIRSWSTGLDLSIDNDKFVFDEYTSISGERFFYFLNNDGLFEMYLPFNP